jgi:hypothetical protein
VAEPAKSAPSFSFKMTHDDRERPEPQREPVWLDDSRELIAQAREMVERNWRFLAELRSWKSAQPDRLANRR